MVGSVGLIVGLVGLMVGFVGGAVLGLVGGLVVGMVEGLVIGGSVEDSVVALVEGLVGLTVAPEQNLHDFLQRTAIHSALFLHSPSAASRAHSGK